MSAVSLDGLLKVSFSGKNISGALLILTRSFDLDLVAFSLTLVYRVTNTVSGEKQRFQSLEISTPTNTIVRARRSRIFF